MRETVIHPTRAGKRRRKAAIPLPIKRGLNPSRVRVPAEAQGLTAEEYLRLVIAGQRLRHDSDDDTALRARFTAGEVVRRDGSKFTPDMPVTPGEDVFFYRIPIDDDSVIPPLPVLFADELITVFAKPHGIVTAPKGSYITRSLVVAGRRTTGNDDLVPIHRLDRLTAGIVVCVNQPEYRGAYQNLFRDCAVDKRYQAVAACPEPAKQLPAVPWTVENRLVKIHGEVQTEVCDGPVNAVTEIVAVSALSATQRQHAANFLPLQADTAYLVLDLHPLTGKTHQLRRHCSDLGYPLVGDPIYPVIHRDQLRAGSPIGVGLGLACTAMTFTDPVTGERREFHYNWLE
ncbi:pseudouridine synthase [Corynebacterium choanae]|uniref:RNA pseudouridylate synthase n=1 Tax=Corynebacterium choanae TaxID=1862358 RepID=A0A3G6J3J0_9CORY|nr:pseudouridine synthase [Corynebacterium choanae]AZA12502.1 Ribosomal large subunit pseudouridine synthase A [Corynebacterium choanae]